MGVTAGLDSFQRRHTWLGFPVAVVYKFIDDQGGYLASLITYYGFLSLFPLAVSSRCFLSLFPLLVSMLGYTLEGDPCLAARVVGSALQHFPLIGRNCSRATTIRHGWFTPGADPPRW